MKITLREMFLLVVIAAMGCGWWWNVKQTKAAMDSLDQRHKKRFESLSAQVKRHLMPKAIPIGDFTIDDSGEEVRLVMPNGRPFSP